MEGPRSLWACLLLISVICANAQQKQIYKMCVNEDKADINNNCKILAKGDSSVNCVFVKDSVDCSLKLKKSVADFSVLTTEESIVASYFIDDLVYVINELRHKDYTLDPYAFQTVAVVKKDFSGGLQGLRKKNFCHPGFLESQFWTDYVLKYFENKVVPPDCNTGRPAAVNELEALKNFFDKTCRPGAWVHNEWYNNKLKVEYDELCSLCDYPGEICNYNTQRSRGQHAAALDCLTRGTGDVTYTALKIAKDYFGITPGFPSYSYNNPADFRFLCQNGSTELLTTAKPCAWIRQPWNPIVANRNIAEDLRNNLSVWLDKPARGSWQETLGKIILENQYVLVNVSQTLPVTEFVKQAREIPQKGSSTCKSPMRWCVTQEESTKCEWMRQAALSHGIQPEIACITANSHWDCFKKIQAGQADFIGIDSNLGYISLHSYDLKTQLYQETLNENNYRAVAVIASNQASNPPINSLDDLKNKKACFSEYGGVAWVAYVEALRKQNVLPNACPYGDTIGKMFQQTCAPGAEDPTHDRKGENAGGNLCTLCPRNCNATVDSVYYGDRGAMHCLTKGGGDVAFLNSLKLTEIAANMSIDLTHYSILCYNGTVKPLRAGFVMDDYCPLVTVVGGEVIGRSTLSKVDSVDFYLALLEMDDWFGLYKHHNEHVFNMFDEFDGKKNLIYREGTVGLISYYDQQLDIVHDYVELKERANQCGAVGSSSVIIIGHVTWMLVALVAVLFAR